MGCRSTACQGDLQVGEHFLDPAGAFEKIEWGPPPCVSVTGHIQNPKLSDERKQKELTTPSMESTAIILIVLPATYFRTRRNKSIGYLRWTPHQVIVTIGDNRDCIRVLLFSYYTTITGWGPPKGYP